VNVLRRDATFDTVVVLGDEEARSLLLGMSPPGFVKPLAHTPRHQRCGAYWCPPRGLERGRVASR